MDHISATQLFAEKLTYRIAVENPGAMRPYLLQGLDASFAARVGKGDILLGGEDFGCGRLIKHAAVGLAAVGVKAVIVKSASRGFYRMALNHGLPVIIAPEIVEAYRPGDAVIVDLSDSKVNVNDREFVLPDWHPVLLDMIAKKGMMKL